MARPLELADLHPLVVAMLEFLPDLPDTGHPAGAWPVDEYELWLRALDANLRLLYGLPDDPADAHLIAGWARRAADAPPTAPPSSPPATTPPPAPPPPARPARASLRPPEVYPVPIPDGWPLDVDAAGGRRKFTDKQKRQAVALADVYGPIATSRALNLSDSVLRAWRLAAADVAARADAVTALEADLAKPIDPAPPDPGTSSPPATVDDTAAVDHDTLRLVDDPADPAAELDDPIVDVGVLRCDLAADRDPDERCGYLADTPDDLDRHLKRRHQLYAGDDPDDVEYRADKVRERLTAAGQSATWPAAG